MTPARHPPSEAPADELLNLVRASRETERELRAEISRLEGALLEERRRLERTRDSNRQLTKTLTDVRGGAMEAEGRVAQERERVVALQREHVELRQRLAHSEAEHVTVDVTRDVAELRAAELEVERGNLRKQLVREREAARVAEARLRAEMLTASESHRRREEAREQRLMELERVVERLERGRGLKRVASLELLLETNEEVIARAEARTNDLELRAEAARAEEVVRAAELVALREELETAQSGFRDAWRSAGEHADEVLGLRSHVERLQVELQGSVQERQRRRVEDVRDLSLAQRGLGELRLAEYALRSLVEGAEAEAEAEKQSRRELLADRAAVLRSVLEGRVALAALREKLTVSRRVQGLSMRLGNLVCPPGADEERQGQANFPLVLELREAQRELRLSWGQVRESEVDLERVEVTLDERETGASWLRGQQRLVDALELQRDALGRALEERAEQMESLERELGDLQLKLAEREETLEGQQYVRQELVREREVSRTARVERARLFTRLRDVERQHEEQVGAMELDLRQASRESQDEAVLLRASLLEAQEDVGALEGELYRMRKAHSGPPKTNAERMFRIKVEDQARAALEEAESHRDLLVEAMAQEQVRVHEDEEVPPASSTAAREDDDAS